MCFGSIIIGIGMDGIFHGALDSQRSCFVNPPPPTHLFSKRVDFGADTTWDEIDIWRAHTHTQRGGGGSISWIFTEHSRIHR
jgi:hypothetical protein